MATLCALAQSGIRTGLIDNSLRPTVTIPDLNAPPESVARLVTATAERLTACFSMPQPSVEIPRGWLHQAGYAEFIAETIRVGMPDAKRSALLNRVGEAIRTINKSIHDAETTHRREIAERDQPEIGKILERAPLSRAAWLLATDHGGSPDRPTILIRRFQAIVAYFAVADTLRTPNITRIIDAGAPLAPALADALAIPKPAMRALVGARRLSAAITSYEDWRDVIAALVDHEVPLWQWPGRGLANQPDAWAQSPWLKRIEPQDRPSTLIRADYHGSDPTQVHDAVEAFRTDLLKPLIAHLARERRTQRWSADENRIAGPLRRDFLRLVRTVLIGPRQPKRFQKAVDQWHHRAATIGALRDERRTHKPGWPALCTPWRSGHYEIIPLTTAAALVAEGRAHQHCVGGYYETCRLGNTQILSLRDSGNPAGTIEISLGDDWQQLQLTVGQFKSGHNRSPDARCRDVLRRFLHDLREGRHPLNVRELRAYRKWASENITPWSSNALPLEHARAVYPFYRPLLPKPGLEDFDTWAEASGLTGGLRALIEKIDAQSSSQPIAA